MVFRVEYWRPDLDGNPKKVSYRVPAEPLLWPYYKQVLVKVEGGPPSEEILARAEALGWKYNPATGTFYLE